MSTIIIAGTGKTALDIGVYFLDRKHTVVWTTGSRTQKAKVLAQLAKLRRQRALVSGESDAPVTGSCCLLSEHTLKTADVIIESTSEILSKKRQVFSSLKHLIAPQTLLFSNSSSLLPETIYPDCLGAHFLFPLFLTGLVELIAPPGCSPNRLKESSLFLKDNNLDILEQKSSNSFLVNRLLLPLQAECFKALLKGMPADTINEASKCGLFPMGQLSLMDSIGLDLVYSAAIQYCPVENAETSPDHLVMLQALRELQMLGKNGSKNRDGLLMGRPLPWPEIQQESQSTTGLTQIFVTKLRSRCRQALDNRETSASELELIFNRAYQVDNFELSRFLEPSNRD